MALRELHKRGLHEHENTGAPEREAASVDQPFKRRRILPAYQEMLDRGELRGTDSTQIVSEGRDGR